MAGNPRKDALTTKKGILQESYPHAAVFSVKVVYPELSLRRRLLQKLDAVLLELSAQ